jgi:hypothetical protein
MSDFTPQMNAALTDLFMAAGGQVGHFCPLKDDNLAPYEALLRYRLIVLQNHEAGLSTRWTAALTDDGRRFFMDYNKLDEEDAQTLPIRETITLTFNLRDTDDSHLYEQLSTLGKNGVLFTKLQQLLALESLLEAGDIDALLESYPELTEKLREKIDMMIQERDNQQMSQVLSEIEAMKVLLKQQPRTHFAPVDIAPPKPNGLRPVVPLTPPEVSPRQLTVPQFEAPSYDDEDSEDLFVVQTDEGAGKRANENFLKSVMSLQEGQGDEEGER